MNERFGGAQVGLPGLIAVIVGGLIFFLCLVRVRSAARSPSPHSGRSRISLVGIAVQILGFASTGFGRIHIARPSASRESILEALLVALLMGAAVWMFVASAREMGRNWSFVARTREDHELVTSGPFARVRHPIYSAMGLCLFAIAVSLGHERNLIWGIPLFVLGTWLRVREEEKLLRASFGATYDAYAARVKRFIPGLL
jgi:protein-S-isoprenylcysteine O-methyltransferase Ste14